MSGVHPFDMSYISNYYTIPLADPQAPDGATQDMIPVEYIDSTSLGERNWRRQNSDFHTRKDTENLSSMHLRRREQNRASQRAFRERKERHVRALENQLQCLHEQHQDLLQSYTRQSEEVRNLNVKINELISELDTLKLATGMVFNDIGSRSMDFDMVADLPVMYPGPASYSTSGETTSRS
ncbi:hypothetical protein PRK78_002263 [Emydomyces testavorans]|uniref:BZIP domain-containing protein n=1 Tax=Emydomyces testavorans TaxID=2070801 RepID=A0AAF0DEL4_9EURO|nr:hypothetical protein PRK78_002263 [Emydomyces testavorans]